MQKTTLVLVVTLVLSGCRQAPEEPLGSFTSATVEEVGAELLRDELGNLDADLAEANQLNAKLLAATHPLRKAYNARFVGQPQPVPQTFIGMLVGLDVDRGASYRLHLIPNAAFRGIWCLSDTLLPILREEEETTLGFEKIDKDVHLFIPLVQGISRRASVIGALAARNAGSDSALLQLRAALAKNFALQVLVELEAPLQEVPIIRLQPGERKILVVQEVLRLQLSNVAKAALQGGSK